jgi:transposase
LVLARAPGRRVCLYMRYAQGGGMTPAEQAARERIRMEAGARFERGESISHVARDLRVGVRQVEKWRSAWRDGGSDALRSRGPQAAARLSGEQFARLEQELQRGPAAHGWDVDQRWTLARIATVVWRLFRISYTPAGISVLLHRNGWTVQVPRRRAIERNDDAVATWVKEVWPQVKPRRRPSMAGSAARTRQAKG